MDGKAVRAIVGSGYDLAAEDFRAIRVDDGGDVEQLAALLPRLSPSSRVLDAGCGCGAPVGKRLRDAGNDVIGLDLSAAQLRLSQHLQVGLQPVQGDLAELPFADGSFDAIVSFYSVIHVPREEHRAVLEEFHRVLVVGGLLLVCMGWSDLPADHDLDSWLGAPMFWSHYDAVTNLKLFADACLIVKRSDEVPDPNGHGSHQFVLAAKPR